MKNDVSKGGVWCAGCDREIGPGHRLVADARKHWHERCWTKRLIERGKRPRRRATRG